MRRRIFEIMEINNKDDLPSTMFDIGLAVTIILNIVAMFCETFSSLKDIKPVFTAIENITVIIFIIEYVLRIITADFLFPDKSKGKAVVCFLISFDGIIELLTILPFFYLSGFIVFRMLRVVRIFHLFRINSQSDSFNVIKSVLFEKKNQIISSVFIIVILMMASSLGIYSAEHNTQPEAFKNAFSGIWWSVSAMLTVGYGDIYPITVAGRIMAIIIAFLGVGAVAIPTGIISAGFVEYYTKEQNSDKKLHDIERVGEVLVTEESSLSGKTVLEIKKEHGSNIYLILRDDLTLIATDNTSVQTGDILIIDSDKVIKKKRK
ncbi:MAG: ion transporter [Ruminococcus sp.]|nr:ion transporter [Ruminococcus sp.]